MKDCIFSVIFPNNLPYFDDYCKALSEQSFKDFIIFLCNDGIVDLQSVLLKYPNLDFEVHEVKGSIPAVRAWALQKLYESNFKYIHFLDTDDYVPTNYLEVKRNLLADYGLSVSDLYIVDQSGTLIKKDKLSARLEEGFVITQDYLSDKNIMGMSNTSIRKDVLYPLDIPDRLVAVDWFVFFQYLKGNTAVFTKKTWTYYRQHGANTLGDGMVSQESILRKIDAMIFHMEALKTTDGAPHEKLRDLYLLKERVSIDKEMLYLAQKDLSKAEIDYFWFEDISSLL